MFTSKTLDLLLTKLPPEAKEAHLTAGIINNLLSIPVLVDAGCEVFFFNNGCEITFHGETIVRGWCDGPRNICVVHVTHLGFT